MKNVRIPLAVVLMLIGVGYMVLTASNAEGIVYRTSTQVRQGADAGRSSRMTGHVAAGSLQKLGAERRVNFTLEDSDSIPIAVTYVGVAPDTLREGSEVVVTGSYDPAKDLFVAKDLLAKCPSKYEGKYEAHPTSVPMPVSPDSRAE